MFLKDGYAKERGLTGEYRPMTFDEAKELKGDVLFKTAYNTVKTCRIQGKVKRWKKRNKDLEVSCKYGLYEFGKFTMEGGKWTSPSFPVIKVN